MCSFSRASTVSSRPFLVFLLACLSLFSGQIGFILLKPSGPEGWLGAWEKRAQGTRRENNGGGGEIGQTWTIDRIFPNCPTIIVIFPPQSTPNPHLSHGTIQTNPAIQG